MNFYLLVTLMSIFIVMLVLAFSVVLANLYDFILKRAFRRFVEWKAHCEDVPDDGMRLTAVHLSEDGTIIFALRNRKGLFNFYLHSGEKFDDFLRGLIAFVSKETKSGDAVEAGVLIGDIFFHLHDSGIDKAVTIRP